jgi:hypothetical protein
MIQVTKEYLKIAKKYGLLYDGSKQPPKNLNKQVNPFFGRTYVVTKHKIWFTDGYNGIYNKVRNIVEKKSKKKR